MGSLEIPKNQGNWKPKVSSETQIFGFSYGYVGVLIMETFEFPSPTSIIANDRGFRWRSTYIVEERDLSQCMNISMDEC